MKTLLCFISLCCVLLSNAEDIHDLTPNNQQGKPSFHFRPPRNWMNDPNGRLYYKGFYHLFYQYNPYGAIFNKTIVWGHSVSRDLFNWIHLKNSIVPTKPFDINSCWSGSTTILPGNKPAILYTGVITKNQQVQNLATPKNLSDPFLQQWRKYSGNPIITPPSGVNPNNFCDPTTAWKGKDGFWRVIIGGLRDNNLGVAILYKSKDFFRWVLHDDPFYSGKNTGIWECPDFYPVFVNGEDGVENSANGMNIKYVLKVSFEGHDYYAIGRYDDEMEKFVSDYEGFSGSGSGLRYYGKFYASKMFFDSARRGEYCGAGLTSRIVQLMMSRKDGLVFR